MLDAPMEFNGILLNDQSQRGLANGKYFKVSSISGLDDADVRDVRIERPGFHGELASDSFYGGRTITISGELRAKNLTALREMESEIKQAFGDLLHHNLVFNPWGQARRFIRARKVQKLDMPDEQATNQYRRPFTVGLRAEDPFAYGMIEQVVDFNEIGIRPNLRTYATAGSPRTRAYPRVYVPDTSTPSPSATNAGNQSAYPVSRIFGYVENPVLENLTTGQRIIFKDLVVRENSFIQINHKTGVIKWQGTNENYSGFDIVNSEFFTLAPGRNELQLSAANYADSAHWQVIWRDTYL